MDSDAIHSSQNDPHSQISKIFAKVHLLSADDEWIKDYYATSHLHKNQYTQNNQIQEPKYNTQLEYYNQFWKMYLTNEMMISKIKQLSTVNSQLNTYLLDLETLLEETPSKPKKKRRVSSQINKSFRCPYNGCQKAYGCDVSMNLHIKLKHGGGNKTQREGLARMICQAELAGKEVPEVKIKFPPGYLQKFRGNYLSQRDQ